MPKSFLVKKRTKSKVYYSDSEDENVYAGEQKQGKSISIYDLAVDIKYMHLSAVATCG
jgi:hypothetical protein